jgi:hypothetical protein
MQGSDALVVIAEISLGLAGFSGIVLVLARRAPSPWDSWRTLSLLGASFGALLLSLIPFGLHFSGVPAPALWRLSSGAMVLYYLAFIAPSFVLLLRLEKSQLPYYWIVGVVASAGSAGNALLQLLNALAIGFSGNLAVFFWGLVWFVFYSAAQFALILFVRPRA